jgi:hypothetical protein
VLQCTQVLAVVSLRSPAEAAQPPAMASRGQVLLLYRQILKSAQRFPSVKRDAIIADIKLEFREGKVRLAWRRKGSLIVLGAALCPILRRGCAIPHSLCFWRSCPAAERGGRDRGAAAHGGRDSLDGAAGGLRVYGLGW